MRCWRQGAMTGRGWGPSRLANSSLYLVSWISRSRLVGGKRGRRNRPNTSLFFNRVFGGSPFARPPYQRLHENNTRKSSVTTLIRYVDYGAGRGGGGWGVRGVAARPGRMAFLERSSCRPEVLSLVFNENEKSLQFRCAGVMASGGGPVS